MGAAPCYLPPPVLQEVGLSRWIREEMCWNATSCSQLLGHSSVSLVLVTSRHLLERKRTEREREKWQRVCSHATPPNSDCKNEWPVSPVSLLASHPPSPPPPALYLLMDPFNYLPHILGRQQARAQYIRWRWYSRQHNTQTQSLFSVELADCYLFLKGFVFSFFLLLVLLIGRNQFPGAQDDVFK